MSTISREHSDRLYWLGRYTERFFTTLKALDRIFDKMLGKDHAYSEYLAHFGLNDTYSDNDEFIRSFLYDPCNPNSAAYSLEKAYDNGIVLREEISTESLSFLQIAKDTLAKSEKSENTRWSLLPLEDIIYSFWGSVNEHIYDDEIRNIIYIGKTVERLDLYIRLVYPYEKVRKEYIRLLKNLNRVPRDTPYRYSTEYLSMIEETLGTESGYSSGAKKAIIGLEHLFDKGEVYA